MESYKKVIICSKLIFFTEKNELIEQNLRLLNVFSQENTYFAILARHGVHSKLKDQLPDEYVSKVNFVDRSDRLRSSITQMKKNGTIFGVIGVVVNDAIFSFNNKIPLFNPEALSSGRVEISDKVKKYGLPIKSFKEVIDCFNAYEIHKTNYFQMQFEDFTVISLNNGNTINRPTDETRIKEIFEANLKGRTSTREQRILLYLLFHLISEVTTNQYFEKVDFWGTFPSSNPENVDTSVAFIKESVRKILNGKPQNGPEILIRIEAMQSKRNSGAARLQNKCDVDFNTLIVNPEIVERLNGQVICIIDDYITNGYSAETAKHLLLKAGAKEVIFVSFGKFGKKYYSTNYEILGDVSTNSYVSNFISERYYGNNQDGEIIYESSNDVTILKFDEIL